MKLGKRLLSFVLALVMVFGLTIEASAANTQNITVQLSPSIAVMYNGEVQNMADVDGNPVYPLLYNGTTYLPIRAVSNMLGVDVDWDGATQTVILTDPAGGRRPVPSTGSTSTKPAPSAVTVQLSPGITVKYNGKVQSMTDVNGTPVYPLLNGGTTYLPIRAVSNMLGVGVDWDGATQTVLLNSEDNAADNGAVIVSPDSATIDKFFREHGLTGVASSAPTQINFHKTTVERIRKTMKMFGYPDYAIEAAVTEFEKNGPNGNDGAFTYEFSLNKKDTFKTSDNTKVTDNTHVTTDYVEVDLSTANDGYVRVKLTEQVTDDVDCHIDGANVLGNPDVLRVFRIKPGQWANVPLLGKSDYYQLTVIPMPYPVLNVSFIATVENPDGWALASDANVDFENAPKTVAKAAELTKNCKTDAEKITAVFEFVAKTIKYDYQMYNDEQSGKALPTDRNLNPDHILGTKTGVCQHYAVLMAAMLRSQGILCKVVSGLVYDGKEWTGHVWVSVSPDTKGLNMSQLGAGHDEDGWIRLDPTWGGTSAGRADAAIDKNHKSEYAY